MEPEMKTKRVAIRHPTGPDQVMKRGGGSKIRQAPQIRPWDRGRHYWHQTANPTLLTTVVLVAKLEECATPRIKKPAYVRPASLTWVFLPLSFAARSWWNSIELPFSPHGCSLTLLLRSGVTLPRVEHNRKSVVLHAGNRNVFGSCRKSKPFVLLGKGWD